MTQTTDSPIDLGEFEGVVGVRPALPSDVNFIFSTWLRDLRHQDSSPLPDDLYFGAYREYINRILADGRVSVLVVHPCDAINEILGYCVALPDEVLVWVYVKPRFRKQGLAKLMLGQTKSLGSPMTFQTASSRERLKNRWRSRQLRKLWSPNSERMENE